MRYQGERTFDADSCVSAAGRLLTVHCRTLRFLFLQQAAHPKELLAIEREASAKAAAESGSAAAAVSSDEEEDEEEDATVYAVSTILSLTDHKTNAAVSQLVKWMLKSCASSSNASGAAALQSALDAGPVGWLINERFLNLPVQLALPMLKALEADVAEAVAAGAPYKFSHLYASAFAPSPYPQPSPSAPAPFSS